MSISIPSSSALYQPLEFDRVDRMRRAPPAQDEITVTMPPNSRFSIKQEANKSTSIEFSWATGQRESWNSGQAIACHITSHGFTLLGAIAGPAGVALFRLLSAAGCAYAFNSVSQDGDS